MRSPDHNAVEQTRATAAHLSDTRKRLIEDGYCVVERAMPVADIARLQGWSDDWLGRTEHPARWKYQGSDLKISGLRSRSARYPHFPADATVDFLIEQPLPLLAALGLGDFRSIGHFQIISKPPGGPPLYWHQDWMRWDDPISLSPWPQVVFLNWYLTATEPRNGCLRAIPGSHRRRIDLHSRLIPPHESGGYDAEETNEWMFCDHPNAVDVPVRPGELLIGDARLLHGTHPNASAERRTVLLGWFVRRSNDVPAGWEGEVPPEILERDAELAAGVNRVPGRYLR